MRKTTQEGSTSNSSSTHSITNAGEGSDVETTSEEMSAVAMLKELVAEALATDSNEVSHNQDPTQSVALPSDSEFLSTLIELNRHILERMDQRFSDLEQLVMEALQLQPGMAQSAEPQSSQDLEHEAAMRAFHKRIQTDTKFGIADDDSDPNHPIRADRTCSIDKPLVECSIEELQTLPGITQADLDHIRHLKDKLESILRETEVELSIERAKLTQQRAELEEREIDLNRREKEMDRKSLQKSSKDDSSKGMLSRMKHFLGQRQKLEE